MTTNVVRLDRLQAGLTAALLAVRPSATVVWAPSEFPRPAAADLVFSCRLLSGPDSEPIGGDSCTMTRLPMAALLTLGVPVVGESAILFASGRRFEHVFASTDVEVERDAWLDELAVDPMVDATFGPSGTDAITIEALELGDLYKLSALGSAELEVTTAETALVQAADVRSWVEIQAYGSSRYPRSGAAAALNAFRGRLNLPMVASILESYGLGLVSGSSAALALNALAGPTWQSRAALTVYIAQLSLAAETVASIARVRATLSARGVNPAADVPIPIDVEPDP